VTDYDRLIERLLVAESQPQLMVAYEAFLEELFRLPLWSPIHPEGCRIHWRDAESAHASLRTMFDAPGLYLFGSCETPLYIGKTKQALWERLRGRYTRGERSQCQLAATYEQTLKEKGITGFPQEIYEEDSKNHPGTLGSPKRAGMGGGEAKKNSLITQVIRLFLCVVALSGAQTVLQGPFHENQKRVDT
jgi:hypothetical protein